MKEYKKIFLFEKKLFAFYKKSYTMYFTAIRSRFFSCIDSRGSI